MMLRHNRSVSHVCQSTDGEPRGCSCLYVTASCCSPTSLSSARSSHSRSLSNDDCNSFHRRLFSSTLSYIGVKRVLKDARDYTRTQQHCHHHHHYHHLNQGHTRPAAAARHMRCMLRLVSHHHSSPQQIILLLIPSANVS